MTQTTELPCKTCLKLAVCKQSTEITCQDMRDWVYKEGLDVYPGDTITEFEKFIGKEIFVIKMRSFEMTSRKRDPNHAVMILKNG